MKNSEINIRDPFILPENGVYYMYGTRANNFGRNVKGFDVYVSTDLENWSEPKECFNSTVYGLDREVNWAPEVHKYEGAYYMFATFRPVCAAHIYLNRILPKGRSCLTATAPLRLSSGSVSTAPYMLKTECLTWYSATSILRLLTGQYAICL